MKTYLSFLIIFLSFSHFFAQNEVENNESITKKLPSVKLKDYKCKVVNTAELGLKGPIVFSFWATWCAPCKKELNAINDLYSDWQA